MSSGKLVNVNNAVNDKLTSTTMLRILNFFLSVDPSSENSPTEEVLRFTSILNDLAFRSANFYDVLFTVRNKTQLKYLVKLQNRRLNNKPSSKEGF